MFLNLIIDKLNFLSTLLIIPFSYLAWKYCFDSYVALSKQYEETKLFKKRHNCVVMYRFKVFIGWPPMQLRMKKYVSKDCLDELYEPLLYFINTTQSSLDVAFMTLTVKPIYKALLGVHHRGVKVRVLLNFEHCNDSENYLKDMIKQGIELVTYISPERNLSNIMHYKYMVKDFKKDGYIFLGSPNISNNAFLNNYEDMVFTASKEVVSAYHNNFEACWEHIKAENQSLVNRVILTDADLI